MLDELLGRAELKERIADLEAEVGHLEARYEAESDRRAEAVRARQEAEERVNRLEDRIADLEGRLEAVDDDEEVSFRGRETLAGERLHSVLARLRSLETGAEGALTAFVAPDSLPDVVADAVGDGAPLVRRAAPCLVCVDDAGLVAVTLAPPAPPDPFATWSDGFELDDGWFLPRTGDVLALVRSDLFVVGQYGSDRDGEWSVVDTIESDVKSTHSKGGFSQGRFERRRDAQVDEHVDQSLDALDALAPAPGRLVVVGEKTVLGAFEARADYVARVDATGDPRAAFEAAVDDFFTTRLSLL
ncbi:Vms1/Ankzf1 family peptidyl-tRNA hydrolase [Salinigranum halophilum]|uniref:Vms1/Ankzf1 family peptidyl-tRNA hydrolase n=1 Tax=Salinigranum halophilum TaxID=2565931 RepID=UPI0010A81F77|nr:Vms1/Ankzf1 family peptidyl-tRNA hydrolase [Salinigranum halophilum]